MGWALFVVIALLVAYFAYLARRAERELAAIAAVSSWGLARVESPDHDVTVGWLPETKHPKLPPFHTKDGTRPTVLVRYPKLGATFCASRRTSGGPVGVHTGDLAFDRRVRVDTDDPEAAALFAALAVRLGVRRLLERSWRICTVTEGEVRVRFFDGHRGEHAVVGHLLEALHVACALAGREALPRGCDACGGEIAPEPGATSPCAACGAPTRDGKLAWPPGAVRWVHAHSVESVLGDAVRIDDAGASRGLPWSTPEERDATLAALRDLGFCLEHAPHGWPPSEVLAQARAEGRAAGRIVIRTHSGPGQSTLRTM
jgi:hypothetical protein